jgi:hypothetical protein
MRPIFLAALLLCGCFGREPPSLKSHDPALKIPAIKQAVDQHDLAACAVLVKDLDSDDPAIRFYAVEGLRKLTGETFDYRYYDDEIARKPAIARWKEWLVAQGLVTAPATTQSR